LAADFVGDSGDCGDSGDSVIIDSGLPDAGVIDMTRPGYKTVDGLLATRHVAEQRVLRD
jgi:hypothetical protein